LLKLAHAVDGCAARRMATRLELLSRGQNPRTPP
jgi:hypothetical protein